MSKTVKVVMQISEKLLEYINKGKDLSDEQNDEIAVAIANGTVLPKGHGRLLILDEKLVRKYFTSFSFSCQKWISEVGISNATWRIIEADKAESEDEK